MNLRPLILVLPKICGYVMIFKETNNKLISFCMNYEKLLEQHKTIWNNIENLKNIELISLTVFDDRYIKS